jgi:hypothetical protein
MDLKTWYKIEDPHHNLNHLQPIPPPKPDKERIYKGVVIYLIFIVAFVAFLYGVFSLC